MNDTIPTIGSEHTMLLVMDYQPAILNNLPYADELLHRAAIAIDTARGSGVQIGYVRVAFTDSDYAAIPETNKIFKMVASGRRMHDGTPETAVHNAVAPKRGDLIVRKTRVGAFSTTDLNQQLHDRKIDTLILAGISTSGVVLSTVRMGADLDYRLYVLEDCCADLDRDVHDFLIRKILPRQAYVISTTDLADLLKSVQ